MTCPHCAGQMRPQREWIENERIVLLVCDECAYGTARECHAEIDALILVATLAMGAK